MPGDRDQGEKAIKKWLKNAEEPRSVPNEDKKNKGARV